MHTQNDIGLQSTHSLQEATWGYSGPHIS